MLKTVEKYLQRATPESQGIASSAILKFVEAAESQIHEFHSFMLLRHGKVLAEGWWSPYAPEKPHMLFSLSKSFTSTAVGLAVGEGHFSLDDKVLSFFPDDAPAEVNEHLAAMQVRHLLSMSTGQVDDTMSVMTGRSDGKWTKGFFEVPVLHEPGTHFLYNTGASYLLSAIVQKTTGMKLVKYLKSRLFNPLGIEHPVWETSPQGINMGGFGLSIITEDIACFGQLYLQKGMWEGKRLLPEGWVEEATSFKVSNGDDPNNDWAQGYAYQFWRCRHNAYRGDGAFGQYCIVMPEQDAVLAITSGVGDMQQPMNLVWDMLLPAMGDDALPDDVTAQEALTQKLASLKLDPVQGEKSSPTAGAVSGKTYKMDANDGHIETIELNFAASGWTVNMKAPKRDAFVPIGYETWAAGEANLFNKPWDSSPIKVVTSGAWTAENTFTMIVRLLETPFYNTFVFRFDGDQLTADINTNVSFEPPKTITLKGQQ